MEESGASDNKLLYVGIGVVGLGLVGIAGWYLLGSKKKTKKGTKKILRSPTSKDAYVNLEQAGKMLPAQLEKALRIAQRDDDIASQINILYILGTQNAKTATKTSVSEAINLYSQALALAQSIDSEMEGPIQVEIALLAYHSGNHPEAIERFESGLKGYLLDRQRAQSLNTKLLVQFFLMLNECYYSLKQFKRGVQYILGYIARLKELDAGKDLLPYLALNVGEFCFLGGDYEGCVAHLEASAETEQALGPEMKWLYYNYLGWAYVRQKKFKEALPSLMKFVEIARTVAVPEGSMLDTLEQISAIHDILHEKEEAVAAFELALEELKKVNLHDSAQLGIKHYYFLGIFCTNRLGMPERGKELLETALVLAKRIPDFPWHSIAMDIADVKYVMKDRDATCAQLSSLAREPRIEGDVLAKVLFKLARVYSEIANKGKALEVYNILIEKLKHLDLKPVPEALVWHRMSKLYLLIGDLEKGRIAIENAKAGVGDDVELKAQIQVACAALQAQSGDREAATKELEALVALTEDPSTRDSIPVPELKTDLGEISLLLGELENAESEFKKALEACSEENMPSAFLSNLRLSSLLATKGQKEKAWEHLAAAKKTADDDKAKSLLGAVEMAIVTYWLRVGDLPKAMEHLKVCADYLDPACCASSPLSLSSYHLSFAECALWLGNRSEALASLAKLQEAVSPSSTSVLKQNLLLCLDNALKIASLYVLAGDYSEAAVAFEGALSLSQERGSKRSMAEAQVLSALINAHAGNPEQESILADGLVLAVHIDDKRLEGRLHACAGMFYTEDAYKDESKAQAQFDQALQLAREVGDKLTEAFALARLALLTNSEEAKTEALALATPLQAQLIVSMLS